MSRPQRKTSGSNPKTQGGLSAWGTLNWDDLELWTSHRSVSRGRAYQRQGRVKGLSLAENGRLLATVVGSEPYVTSAWLDPPKGSAPRIESRCTCPVAVCCKHAVAAIAELLAEIAVEREVPSAQPDDPRWAILSGDAEPDCDADSDEYDVVENPPGAKPRHSRSESSRRIKEYIRGKSQTELAALVETLIGRFPELRQEFQERILLAQGNMSRLLTAARREMRAITAESGWRNHWTHEGHTPNYSRLKHKLERLIELGHADEVAELGRDLITRGFEQIGQSQDEGETATELSDCLQAVFDAVAKSGLAAPEKILYAIDACLQDEYDILGPGVDNLLNSNQSREDWSVVADILSERLLEMPAGDRREDFLRNYHRSRLADFLADALTRAGRERELLALYEAEARATDSYVRLVNYLIEQEKFEDAQRWAREGIEATRSKYPGIAMQLAQSMCEMAQRRKQWKIVAAHAAHAFWERPAAETFKELMAAAKRAGCQKRVSAAAQQFLETGVSPLQTSAGPKDNHASCADSFWPLPVLDYLESLTTPARRQSAPKPHFNVLIDLAIAGERPADVLRWFDEMSCRTKQTQFGRFDIRYDVERVAKAISSDYPERALEIYRGMLDEQLRQTGMTAYENCVSYLRQMGDIYQRLGREDDWTELVAGIRHQYRNRPRFMELLDRLPGGTIVQALKSSSLR